MMLPHGIEPCQLEKVDRAAKHMRERWEQDCNLRFCLLRKSRHHTQEKLSLPHRFLDIDNAVWNRRKISLLLQYFNLVKGLATEPPVIAASVDVKRAEFKETIGGHREDSVWQLRDGWLKNPAVTELLFRYEGALNASFAAFNLQAVAVWWRLAIGRDSFPTWAELNSRPDKVDERGWLFAWREGSCRFWQIKMHPRSYGAECAGLKKMLSSIEDSAYSEGGRFFSLAGRLAGELGEREYGRLFVMTRDEVDLGVMRMLEKKDGGEES